MLTFDLCDLSSFLLILYPPNCNYHIKMDECDVFVKGALKSKSCLSKPSYAEAAIFEPAPDFLECSVSQPYFTGVLGP